MLAVALVLAQSLLGELGPVENTPPAPVVVEQAAKPARQGKTVIKRTRRNKK